MPDYGIIHGMEKFVNIAGPRVLPKYYMLPALARLPEVRYLAGL